MLIAPVIIGILIAAFVLLSITSRRSLDMDEFLRLFGLSSSKRDGSGGVNKDKDSDCPLKTKRLVVGQITICRGCCCGNVERGLSEVPVEWMKSEWRKRGLLKRVQLTISGCVGPCDVPNVVVITSASGTEWIGNVVELKQYRSLMEWAVQCKEPSC
jgi:hypothetical protein